MVGRYGETVMRVQHELVACSEKGPVKPGFFRRLMNIRRLHGCHRPIGRVLVEIIILDYRQGMAQFEANENPIFQGGLELVLTLPECAAKGDYTFARGNTTRVAPVLKLVISSLSKRSLNVAARIKKCSSATGTCNQGEEKADSVRITSEFCIQIELQHDSADSLPKTQTKSEQCGIVCAKQDATLPMTKRVGQALFIQSGV